MIENNCYKCQHRREVAGSVHSRCVHPAIPPPDPFTEVMAIFASAGRTDPLINLEAWEQLNIKANVHGIRRGWFNWPLDFDPAWLENCDGFERLPKKEKDA